MRKDARKFRNDGVFILLAFLIAITFLWPGMAHSALLYSNVQISDVGTGNTIANANTSRNLAVTSDGTIYSVFRGSEGIRVAASINRGQSFSPSVQVSPTSFEAEIAVSSNGNVYVVWVDASTVKFSRSTDGGATFSAPMDVGSAGALSYHMRTDASNVYLFARNGVNFYYS